MKALYSVAHANIKQPFLYFEYLLLHNSLAISKISSFLATYVWSTATYRDPPQQTPKQPTSLFQTQQESPWVLLYTMVIVPRFYLPFFGDSALFLDRTEFPIREMLRL